MSKENNKFLTEKNMKFLSGLPLLMFLRCHNPSLEISTTRGYTLIPRAMTTNIRVFGIILDIHMDRVSQSQHPNVYYHVDRATSYPISNNNMDDIHIATCKGNVNWVRDMISRKKELLWCKDAQGNLPLHLALDKGHKKVAEYLIGEFPQGSYALNQFEKSPIYLGVVNGHKDLVEFMLEKLDSDKEATKSLRKGKSILFAAIDAKSQEMVELILKHQPKLIKTTNNKGWSPLAYASYNGLTNIVSCFFRETFPDILHKDYSYPIHKACIGGHVDILKKFRFHCPKYFTKPDENGLTILHHAAKEPNNRLKDVVSYLLSLQEGRKLIKINDGITNRTPLALAQYSRNDEVVEILRQNMSS